MLREDYQLTMAQKILWLVTTYHWYIYAMQTTKIVHFFRCPGRACGRREWFTERLPWTDRVTKKPMEVLSYMIREGVALRGLTRSRQRRNKPISLI